MLWDLLKPTLRARGGVRPCVYAGERVIHVGVGVKGGFRLLHNSLCSFFFYCIWTTEFPYRGNKVYPRRRQKLTEKANEWRKMKSCQQRSVINSFCFWTFGLDEPPLNGRIWYRAPCIKFQLNTPSCMSSRAAGWNSVTSFVVAFFFPSSNPEEKSCCPIYCLFSLTAVQLNCVFQEGKRYYI